MKRSISMGMFQLLRRILLVGCLCWLPSTPLFAQGSGAAGRTSLDFQLTLLRPQIVSFHGQQPPYEWSAVYAGTNPTPEDNTQIFLRDSSVCGVGTAGSASFNDDVAGSYEYDGNGNLTTAVYRMNDGAGNFELFSKKIFSYTNQEVSYLYQRWDENSVSWKNDYEEISTFDTEGRQTEFTIREVDMNGSWNNLFRETRSYDQDNRLSEVRSAEWNGTAWNDTMLKEISYNALGLYTTIIDFSSNGSGWDTLSRESAQYEQFGLQWSNYLLEVMTLDGLQPSIRESYFHNQDGDWTGMTRESWNLFTSSWENDSREQYEYTSKGFWTAWTKQTFDGAVWENEARQEAVNNGTTRDEVMKTWNAGTQSWEDEVRMTVELNQNTYIVRETGNQIWDQASNDWINSNQTRQCRYFWTTDQVNSLTPTFPQMNCHLENPYRAYSPIDCEAMTPGREYTIRLIDIQGRTVYQQMVEGGRQISVDRTVPQGVYVLTISEDNRLQYSRKVLFNN